MSANDLARLCEVHERTIYRDIDTVNACGIPCAYDKESRGYRVPPGFFMPPEFTFGEAMAIPYAPWFCQRAWYVVGHHSARGEVRRLKLNSFTSVEVTDRAFAIPDDCNIHGDLGKAWRMIRGEMTHHIAVRFKAAFADTASETRWHSTQQEEWDDDTGVVTLRFTVDGLHEIVCRVLGYGLGAKVLKPPELTERVRALARATAEQYARP